jgi:hypothetical protein
MQDEEQRYLAFLVRFWQIRKRGKLVWRASAESAQTGERTAFADMDLLFSFLRRCTEEQALPGEAGRPAGDGEPALQHSVPSEDAGKGGRD